MKKMLIIFLGLISVSAFSQINLSDDVFKAVNLALHKDVDLENRIVNIDHQLQRLSDMTLVIEPTKTSAGTRKLPVTEDVAKCFQAILTGVNTLAIFKRNKRSIDVLYGIVMSFSHKHSTSFKRDFSETNFGFA